MESLAQQASKLFDRIEELESELAHMYKEVPDTLYKASDNPIGAISTRAVIQYDISNQRLRISWAWVELIAVWKLMGEASADDWHCAMNQYETLRKELF